MSLAFVLMVAVFAACFLLRMPLGYGLISAGIVYLFVAGEQMSQAAQLIAGGFNAQFILIAVPLFIFAAQIMNSSTVTDRMFDFAHAVVGRLRGGLAQVNVVNSVIFSGMSGSAVADTSGVGLVEIKAMTDNGYPRGFACATTAATATVGPIIPPSIPMVIFASLTGTSVGTLFAGGVVPGLLLAGMQMVLIRFVAARRDFPRGTWDGFAALLTSLLRALPALLTPAILLGGIYSGAFTPTEAAAVASLYAMILAFAVYRTMTPSAFWTMFHGVVKQTAAVSLIIGGAFIVNYAVAAEGLPRRAADAVLGITESPLLLLFVICTLFLLIDVVVDTTVMLLVFIPIAFPITVQVGIDPVHFGVVITLAMMIGLSLPPIGVSLLITSQMSRTPLGEVIADIWQYLAIMIATLVMLILVPDIVLWLPRLTGYDG